MALAQGFDQKYIAEYILFMLPDSELKQNSGGLGYFLHNLTSKLRTF